jgi:hypothetical protein
MRRSSSIIGGAFIANFALDIPFFTFLSRIQEVVPITDIWVGMIKAPFFGLIIGDGGLLSGHAGQGQCRGSRPAHNDGGGPGDLHGDRARCLLRGVLHRMGWGWDDERS